MDPVLLALLEATDTVADALLMVQREYALRLHAAPGGKAYGSISVLLQARYRVVPVLDVSPRAFYPPPSVTSQVVSLRPLAEPAVPPAHWTALKTLLRAAFSARRKMLAKGLTTGLDLPRDVVLKALERAEILPTLRPEEVPVTAWARLAAVPLAGVPGSVDILSD